MIAIGLGCRKGASGNAITSLIEEALGRVGRLPATEPVALFTCDIKAGEAGLSEAAATLAFPLHFLPQKALALEAGRIKTPSERVFELFGVPSIAEAAALAGAGPNGALILERISENGVTCAVARGTGGTANGGAA